MIADKEKKSSSYKESKLDALSDEKVAKIKKFAKEYIAKVLRKMEKSGEKHKGSSSTTTAIAQAGPSVSNDTSNSHEDGDIVTGDIPLESHEAMGLGGDSDSDMGDEDEGHEDHGSPSAPPPDLKDEPMDISPGTSRRWHTNGWNSRDENGGGSPNGSGADGNTLSVAS